MTSPASPTKKRKPKRVRRAADPSRPAYDKKPSKAAAPDPQGERFDPPSAVALPDPIDPRTLATLWIGGALLTVATTIGVGVAIGPAPGVLVLVGAAFIAVISLFWSSVRTALGETPLAGADAFAIGAPRHEEEQKRAVLRALKDLEFERTVGKISEQDHRVLVAQYRAQAKALLRRIDELSAENRERAEEIMRERGIVLRPKEEAAPAPGPAMKFDDEPKTEAEGGEEAEGA